MKLLTVNCRIPGGLGEYVSPYSDNSLLDADLILFNPSAHFDWEDRLRDVLEAGKTVFFLLTKNVFNKESGYPCLPFEAEVYVSSGNQMRLQPGSMILHEYWSKFAQISSYEVYLDEAASFESLITTRGGEHAVSGIYREPCAGSIVALPCIDLGHERFSEGVDEDDNYIWNSEGKEWGKQYFEILQSIHDNLQSRTGETQVPSWTQAESYMTDEELRLSTELTQIEKDISNLVNKRDEVRITIREAGRLKGLLFQQGRPLEQVVKHAMRLLGFLVSQYQDAHLEIDLVLECPEGRGIGEVEGKDTRPIHITKMRQLTTNIEQDLFRDGVVERAKPILIGNAYRLQSPEERPADHFTTKCIEVARITNTALVRTCDLFEAAKAMSDCPDQAFATSCRRAIFDANGEEVRFPKCGQ